MFSAPAAELSAYNREESLTEGCVLLSWKVEHRRQPEGEKNVNMLVNTYYVIAILNMLSSPYLPQPQSQAQWHRFTISVLEKKR